MAINLDKQWVALRFKDGNYTVVADYGDYAWGAATYTVLGYFPTRDWAQQAVRADIRSIDLPRAAS